MMMVRSVENCNMLLYIAWSLLCLLEADGSSYSLVSLLFSGLGVSMGLGVLISHEVVDLFTDRNK